MLEIAKIADDLVAQKFSVIKKIFTEELLNALHDEIVVIDQNNDLRRAGVGRDEDYTLEKTIRKDKIHWIDNSTKAQQSLSQELENLRLQLNKNLMLGLFDFEAHFAVYEKGDFYKKHLDSFKGARNRVVSLVIYLNKNWQENDGGTLNLYHEMDDQKPLLSLSPNWGNAVLFLSEEIPHEVTIANKTRYSIAVWFRVREIDSVGI